MPRHVSNGTLAYPLQQLTPHSGRVSYPWKMLLVHFPLSSVSQSTEADPAVCRLRGLNSAVTVSHTVEELSRDTITQFQVFCTPAHPIESLCTHPQLCISHNDAEASNCIAQPAYTSTVKQSGRQSGRQSGSRSYLFSLHALQQTLHVHLYSAVVVSGHHIRRALERPMAVKVWSEHCALLLHVHLQYTPRMQQWQPGVCCTAVMWLRLLPNACVTDTSLADTIDFSCSRPEAR